MEDLLGEGLTTPGRPCFNYLMSNHSRQITQTDGVSDETAIQWSDQEDANRHAGTTGKHRR